MARTNLPKTVLGGSYPGTGVSPTFTASDPVNGNEFVLTGKELLLVKNIGAVSRTITLFTAPDSFGREADVVATLASGAQALFGPFQMYGWAQAVTLTFEVTASHADVQIAVLVLP
jgi:hypothetical protein